MVGLAHIGSGGQKWVFSADHPSLGSVVLKLIKPGASPELVEREVFAVQRVASVRVPTILEVGMLDTPFGQCVWILEERILGSVVSDLVRSGPLGWKQVLTLGLHALQALTDAERARIVHRDVKPANMMSDSKGNFWLLDFGLARHLQLLSLTPTADSFGKCTPGYAPPEQFRNAKSDIDSRSDLFALGVTLYECSTGFNPFVAGARDVLEILSRVERIPLQPLNGNGFASAREFSDFVACMTQRRRDHRPRSAMEALTWLSEICNREGIH